MCGKEKLDATPTTVDAIGYAKERHAFGKPIIMNPAIAFTLANMITEIDTIFDGTSEIQQLVIARAISGLQIEESSGDSRSLVARGEDSATSDVDVLVDLEPTRTLLDLLQRDVAVVMEQGLRPCVAAPQPLSTESASEPLDPHRAGRVAWSPPARDGVADAVIDLRQLVAVAEVTATIRTTRAEMQHAEPRHGSGPRPTWTGFASTCAP